MSEVISIEQHLLNKLAKHRSDMQTLLDRAIKLIDEAVEKKSFNLVVEARRITNLAVIESERIKVIERFLHIETEKVHVDKAV